MKIKNIVAALLIIPILFGCSKEEIKEEKQINLPPAQFKITTSEITDRSAKITWTEAIDPDGDQIHYRILFMNEKIEENNSSKEYIFNGLQPENDYQVKIEASDGVNKVYSEVSFTTNSFTPRIFEGSVLLQSQQEVKEFGKEDYNVITGWLYLMNQYGPPTDISDLSPLSGLIEIGGELRIFKSQLKNLEGLNNLKKILGPVEISTNEKLINLQGLESLISIEGRMDIGGHPLLENIDPISKVSGIKELYLNSNAKLTKVNLMQDEEVIYFLNISGNESLETVEGFEKVKEVQTHIQIYENPVLKDLPNFSELVRVEKQISIANTISTSLGFPKLEYAGSIYLEKNLQLVKLKGFSRLLAVESNVIISDNKLLEDFCNFITLATPAGNFMTYGNAFNPNLQSIKAGECKLD